MSKEQHIKIKSFTPETDSITVELLFSAARWKKVLSAARQELGRKLKDAKGYPKGKPLPDKLLDSKLDKNDTLRFSERVMLVAAYDYVAREKSSEIEGFRPAEEGGKEEKSGEYLVKLFYLRVPKILKLGEYHERSFNVELEKPPEREVNILLKMRLASAGEKVLAFGPTTEDYTIYADVQIFEVKSKKPFIDQKDAPTWLGIEFFLPEVEKNLIGLDVPSDVEFVGPFEFAPGDIRPCRFSLKIKRAEIRKPISIAELCKKENLANERALREKIANELMESRFGGPGGVVHARGEKIILDITRESEFDIPKPIFESEFENVKRNRFAAIEQKTKLKIDEFAKKNGKTVDQLTALLREQFEEFIKSGLVFREIAEREKLEATPDEMKDLMEKAGMSEQQASYRIVQEKTAVFLVKLNEKNSGKNSGKRA